MTKSKFLTLFFSLLPGAGHMYLGYMKRGLSIMVLFFLAVAISSISPVAGFALPVIWFFGLFDALHLLSEYRADGTIYDSWLIDIGAWNTLLHGKTSTVCGICLVVLGALGFYHYVLEYPLYTLVKDIPVVSSIVRNLPSLLLCVLMFVFGIIMLRGRRETENS